VKTLNLTNLQIVAMPNRIVKLPSVLVWVAQLVACGLTHKYDIVQIESFPLPRTLALFLLLRPFSRKFIIVFHDKWFKQDPRKSVIGRLRLLLQRILLILFDASIIPGKSVKNWFEELHGKLVHEKMVVIPNGVPNLTIKKNINSSHLRKKYGIPSNTFVALFFGSMTFKPNYEAAMHLYKISNSVCSKFEKITKRKLIFVVAGIGSEILPKTENFLPLGFVEKLDELLSLPHVIVLPHTPSYSGPHVKTIYAFLSRKPVVATEDAVKDMPYINPKKHFLLFDIKSPNTLIDALLKLYYNKKLRKRLTLNAYQYAKKFSWERISLLHLKLYNNMLQKHI